MLNRVSKSQSQSSAESWMQTSKTNQMTSSKKRRKLRISVTQSKQKFLPLKLRQSKKNHPNYLRFSYQKLRKKLLKNQLRIQFSRFRSRFSQLMRLNKKRQLLRPNKKRQLLRHNKKRQLLRLNKKSHCAVQTLKRTSKHLMAFYPSRAMRNGGIECLTRPLS